MTETLVQAISAARTIRELQAALTKMKPVSCTVVTSLTSLLMPINCQSTEKKRRWMKFALRFNSKPSQLAQWPGVTIQTVNPPVTLFTMAQRSNNKQTLRWCQKRSTKTKVEVTRIWSFLCHETVQADLLSFAGNPSTDCHYCAGCEEPVAFCYGAGINTDSAALVASRGFGRAQNSLLDKSAPWRQNQQTCCFRFTRVIGWAKHARQSNQSNRGIIWR